ncbi:MAG TPA: hypothetical protein VFR41_04795 [Acidimicrobiia bacterium]|jgi:hypothetical protein|nr:hypothetical protein [Acidimicrobiia bacterium]
MGRETPRTRSALTALDEARFGPGRTLNLRAVLPTPAQATARAESWLRQKQVERAGDVLVITGRGNQSVAGVSVVRQAVLSLLRTLRRRGVVGAVREHTAGSFVVTLAPLSSLRSAPSRRKDPTPAPTTDPRMLSGLSRETRKLLRSVALCSLESLGVRAPEAFVEREMLEQLSHLGATIRDGPMREERLRQALLVVLEELEHR